MISYTAYTYSRQEKIRYGVVGIVLGAIIGMLFFNRIPAVIALGGLGGMVYLLQQGFIKAAAGDITFAV